MERSSTRRQRDLDFSTVLRVGPSLDEARRFEPLEDLCHATRGAPQMAMELARTERVGPTGTSQCRENAIITRCELERFEDVALDGVDQVAQSRQANEWQ